MHCNHSARSHWLTAFLLVVLALPLGACGLTARQKDAISKFAVATQQLSDVSAAELTQIRSDTVMLRTEMMAINPKSVDLTSRAEDLDGPCNLDALDVRLKALSALKSYGSLLNSLATDDVSANVSASATTILGNLKQLKSLNLTDDKAQVIGTAINALSNLAIEGYKAKTVRKIVPRLNPAMIAIATLVRDDLDPGVVGGFASGLNNTIHEKIDDTLVKYVELLQPGTGSTAEDISAKKAALSTLQADCARVDSQLKNAQAQIQPAITNFSSSSSSLMVSVTSTDVSSDDIDAYFVQVTNLVRIYKAIRGSF
ncbi:MAG TPA: hypothetical protein VM008_11165 [Phycisphaerae bacterium]|nr:hypothetical protein [Phycisphaerae bacterium]